MATFRSVPAVLAAAALAACSSGSPSPAASAAAGASSAASSAASAASSALASAASAVASSAASAGVDVSPVDVPTDLPSLALPTDLPIEIPTDLPSLDLPTDISTGKGCENLSAGAISTAAGFSVSAPQAQKMGPIVLCTFTGPLGSAVLVRKETGMGVEAFDAGKAALEAAGQKTAPLSGIGDAAYSSTFGAAGKMVAVTVVARKGNDDVLVTLAGPTATLDKAVAVAKVSLDAF